MTRVLLVPDLPLERWPSMDRYAHRLHDWLESSGPGFEVRLAAHIGELTREGTNGRRARGYPRGGGEGGGPTGGGRGAGPAGGGSSRARCASRSATRRATSFIRGGCGARRSGRRSSTSSIMP